MKRSSSNETSDSIPIDLIIEILSRLPAKPIARFRCVSKLWGSMLHRPYFTELFLTRSLARPRILFAIKLRRGGWRFYSSLQPQNPYEKSSSLEVAADFHTKFSGNQNMSIYPTRRPQVSCRYDSGLVYISRMWISKEDGDAVPVICNPSTGLYAILPKPWYTDSHSFLGFDPIDKQYKVLLFMSHPRSNDMDSKILTLGTGTMMWRNIEYPFTHSLCCSLLETWICINGVLYYFDEQVGDMSLVIVCFDVRSEKFKFIEVDSFCYRSSILMNYKGKLGGIGFVYVDAGGRRTLELSVWVLEDVEKQEWSKHVYTTPENKLFDDCFISVAGVTATGEIVLSTWYRYRLPFYVFYFNPEKNTLQTVEIQGVGEYRETFENRSSFRVFVDHVEDLNFIT